MCWCSKEISDDFCTRGIVWWLLLTCAIGLCSLTAGGVCYLPVRHSPIDACRHSDWQEPPRPGQLSVSREHSSSAHPREEMVSGRFWSGSTHDLCATLQTLSDMDSFVYSQDCEHDHLMWPYACSCKFGQRCLKIVFFFSQRQVINEIKNWCFSCSADIRPDLFLPVCLQVYGASNDCTVRRYFALWFHLHWNVSINCFCFRSWWLVCHPCLVVHVWMACLDLFVDILCVCVCVCERERGGGGGRERRSFLGNWICMCVRVC